MQGRFERGHRRGEFRALVSPAAQGAAGDPTGPFDFRHPVHEHPGSLGDGAKAAPAYTRGSEDGKGLRSVAGRRLAGTA